MLSMPLSDDPPQKAALFGDPGEGGGAKRRKEGCRRYKCKYFAVTVKRRPCITPPPGLRPGAPSSEGAVFRPYRFSVWQCAQASQTR
jgi:hypothetical protein